MQNLPIELNRQIWSYVGYEQLRPPSYYPMYNIINILKFNKITHDSNYDLYKEDDFYWLMERTVLSISAIHWKGRMGIKRLWRNIDDHCYNCKIKILNYDYYFTTDDGHYRCYDC